MIYMCTNDWSLCLSHTAILPGKESNIVVFKGSQMLGLILVGGVDTYLSEIYIQKIIPDSPAAKDGRLQPGDRLLQARLLLLVMAFS